MTAPIRLLALAAAPVFYQVPLYRKLAEDPRVELTVVYASSGGARAYDAGFGRPVTWDVDLLAGYRHESLRWAATNDVRAGFFALHDWDVAARVLRGDVDVLWVHSYSYLTTWLAIAAARMRGIPVLLREEQTLLRERPRPKRWIRAAVLRLLFRRIHALSIGSANRAYFRRFGVPERRIFFAPYAADNDALQSEARALAPRRLELRRAFGIADDAGPVILVVSKLVPGKGIETALDAYQTLRKQARCALLVVGDGDLADPLERRVADEGLDGVRLAGFLNRSEIGRAFAAADVLLVPSHSDTWGLVVNEAMNFGLPVVATAGVGSAYDLIRGNGAIVPVADPGATAAALAEVLQSEDERRRLGARSRELVDAWTFERTAEGIVEAATYATGRGARLRVALLPLQPRSSAATRAYCERPVDELRRRGIDTTLLPPPAAGLHDRLKHAGSARIPLTAAYWYLLALPVRLVQIMRALTHDVVFVQRGLLRARSAPFLEAALFLLARACGRPVVYHADDALHAVARRRTMWRYRLATVVATGSDEVAAAAAAAGARAVRLETGIDVDRYPVRRHRPDGPVVIGWVGTNPGDHLGPVAAAVERIARDDDVVLRVCSARPYQPEGAGGTVEWVPWSPEREQTAFEGLDIGVMPLSDTPYNRGKEAYKVKEYMAAGLPVVCSPVGHNLTVVEDGVTGFFAAEPGEWEERLRLLVRSPELRARLGAAGRLRAQRLFTVDAQAASLAALFFAVRRARAEREVVAS